MQLLRKKEIWKCSLQSMFLTSWIYVNIKHMHFWILNIYERKWGTNFINFFILNLTAKLEEVNPPPYNDVCV